MESAGSQASPELALPEGRCQGVGLCQQRCDMRRFRPGKPGCQPPAHHNSRPTKGSRCSPKILLFLRSRQSRLHLLPGRSHMLAKARPAMFLSSAAECARKREAVAQGGLQWEQRRPKARACGKSRHPCGCREGLRAWWEWWADLENPLQVSVRTVPLWGRRRTLRQPSEEAGVGGGGSKETRLVAVAEVI